MPIYYNGNDEYGMSGPFEAESKEAIADEYEEKSFADWLGQAWNQMDVEEQNEYGTFEDYSAIKIPQMRVEFIAGLEEV